MLCQHIIYNILDKENVFYTKYVFEYVLWKQVIYNLQKRIENFLKGV